ncbi:M24 family metallopeptidase [Alkaliphilus peptidifermentans]|uniref:Xaa-Pro aminopeptidase n=1 Tax=Alkaliphilus peptidifermentans DSM 18978 TaxID=1120976 RepID=A0A1G5E2X6_9FIRM|nr:Xaa-Pro peptidase family protein [Alkaliphilus peptidifermentans]SCY21403.1 Xaa-Pro aminopeptidase [Alkaliphilus peptidifermentans DSM 18978]
MFNKIMLLMQNEFIDGLLISNPYNVQYISGYREQHAYALITEKGRYLLTDGRYKELASKTTRGFQIIDWQKKEYKLKEAINELIKEENIKRLGFEAEYITYKQFTDLYDMIQAEITPVVGMIEKLREIKSPEEIYNLKIACQINDMVFLKLLDEIKVGITEKELSALCEYYIKKEGGDAQVSESVFLAGKRSSLILGSPTDARLEKGDFLLMNYGARYKGYMSDFSRTVVIGKPDSEQKRIYEVVQNAQNAAINSIKAGVLAKEPFFKSAKVFEEADLIRYHYEGMGHGIGLFLHEEPFLDKNSKNILEKNAVLTVEPGIYIPEWGGVRLEDIIVVTETGSELLSKTTRELIEI